MKTICIIIIVGLLPFYFASATMPVTTFSIVGYDPSSGELGVAVASKYFAVGSIVPWAKSGVGAVATQSWVNPDYGPIGLDLLAVGLSPQQVIDSLTRADSMFERRQVGVINSKGEAATFTGKGCLAWAGGKIGKNCVAQGNILVSESVVNSMVAAFENTKGELADKLMAALLSGDSAGGDSRGKQSAAVYVVKPTPGNRYDTKIDIRVDDHPQPFSELKRLYSIAKALSRLDLAYNLRQKGDMEGAVKAARESVELNPDLPETHYDLACYLSLSGNLDLAMKSLRTALRKSPRFKPMAAGDPDLEALRQRNDFRKLISDKR
jgi:uncharacterized Ntn-hydrolase superfamily protein